MEENQQKTDPVQEVIDFLARAPRDKNGTLIYPSESGWRIRITDKNGKIYDDPILDASDIEHCNGEWHVAWGGPSYGAERLSDCIATREEE